MESKKMVESKVKKTHKRVEVYVNNLTVFSIFPGLYVGYMRLAFV